MVIDIKNTSYGLCGDLDITEDTFRKLRRIALTLRAWSLHTSRGTIQRVGDDLKPYWYDPKTQQAIRPAKDRGVSSIYRLLEWRKGRPSLDFYIDPDPRGYSLYIYRRADLADSRPISQVYKTIGYPIY